MKIFHVVPGLNEPTNGIAVAAKWIAAEQSKSGAEVEVVETREFASSAVRPSTFDLRPLSAYAEIWVHSMWLPMTLKACWKVLQLKRANLHSTTTTSNYNSSPRLVRMTHANLDPLRYRFHGWKKRLVAPVERWLFKRTDRVVVTCAAEKEWCEKWIGKSCPEIEMLDLKRFFDLDKPKSKSAIEQREIAEGLREQRNLHVLYLGRRHPLKGVEFLERAVGEANEEVRMMNDEWWKVDLRIVSNHFGEELERDWEWCDVLCLPTLSENFGLVVAEALERGKRVITTDGASAWTPQVKNDTSALQLQLPPTTSAYNSRLIYLKGFRDGTDEERVKMLKEALKSLSAQGRSTFLRG